MGRLAFVNNQVRDAHRAQADSGLVGDHNFVTGDGLSQLKSCGHSRHDSITHTAMVGAADIQAHRHFSERARVNHGSPRAERFTKGHRGPAVQQPKRLGIAVDGHRRNDALGRLFENHDAEFVVEGSELNRPWRVRNDVILPTVHQAERRTTCP